MFHIAEGTLYFDILVIFNEVEDNFVFALNIPGKVPLFTDHFITQFLKLFRISIIWIVLILLS